jgi:hypothetical protein
MSDVQQELYEALKTLKLAEESLETLLKGLYQPFRPSSLETSDTRHRNIEAS